ncbi:TIGR01457 family HAD-type hydrolase [Companilactobacillus halodurans]|uniref:Acid sugar phosphatase n=1 Tax=Companilactobacillus halodurans TaxID=2584183 RepID=A0A5P0ZVH2_9LACO|nr:TIGR01457 family HAD-type hydrolase [Companilactobacillus halodurans]MQS76524.1 TIGR01457 family HAD-type hydrolase [Companilactobacillus halodurans]MQS96905.1 TIGR01457 family HAD-type hydrolase [Companilactobacillus halodurans]
MKYQTYLIDLDGTMYRGKAKIPEARVFVDNLNQKEIDYYFLTNNTTKTPQQVADNLTNNHQITAKADQVVTPSLATAAYIKDMFGEDISNHSAYVIGEYGLKSAIFGTGIKLNEYDPDVVIVGLDYDVTYHKFELATLAIKRGALFIGTNADTNLPNERGLVPGAGSVISLVETSTQQRAHYIGKPEPEMIDFAVEAKKFDKSSALMVGDNYNTDIKCGISAGVDTLLVYTGVSTHDDIKKVSVKPTHEVESLDKWDV